MTSRRSRLKAVTNLPVRRKTFTLQGSAIQGSLVDNLSSEKVYSSDPKVDEAIAVSRSTGQPVVNDLNDSSDKNNENESIVLNCAGGFQNNSCYINVDVISGNEEPNHINLFENAISIRKVGEENSDSAIDTESLQPVLTNLSNSNTSQEVSSINLESLNSHFTELKNASKNLFSKARLKSQTLNIKTNFSRRHEYYNNSLPQTRDLQVLENTELLNAQNVSSDLNCKQSISTVRRKRSKCNDFTKKLADAKREFQKKYEKTKPDRSTLKMIDLIFYNPSTNPMESKAKFEKKETTTPGSDVISDLLAEERVDEPESLDCNSKSNLSDNVETENLNKMPVPQVKIGLDGEIILDEKSLIIETTEAKKGREELYNSVPVFEDNGCKVSYYRGKSKKTRDWADFETKRFYKALNTIGPDFSLMQKYFPKRSRLELKNKFKREERLNRNLIDKALNNPSEFDMTQLEKDLAVEKEAEEEEVEMRLCKIIKQTAKRPKVKSSLLSREIIESGEFENSLSKSFEAYSKRLSESEKNKKEKEFDFVFQKLLMKESEESRSKLPEISSSFPGTFKDSGHGVT